MQPPSAPYSTLPKSTPSALAGTLQPLPRGDLTGYRLPGAVQGGRDAQDADVGFAATCRSTSAYSLQTVILTSSGASRDTITSVRTAAKDHPARLAGTKEDYLHVEMGSVWLRTS